MSTKPKITFYFDIVSPFSYEAFHVITHDPIFKQCDVIFVPALLTGVFKSTKNSPPLVVPQKVPYMGKERVRWARLFDIPMTKDNPANWPFNTIQCQKVLLHIQQHHSTQYIPTISALFSALWADGNSAGIHKNDGLTAVLASVLGAELAEKVMKQASTPEAKQALEAKTKEAVDAGAFGMPWFVGEDKEGRKDGFFGFDHLGVLAKHLGLDGQIGSGNGRGRGAML